MKRNHKFIYALLAAGLLVTGCGQSTQKTEEPDASSPDITEAFIQENIAFSVKQYEHLSTLVPEDKLPRTFIQEEAKSVSSGTSWWTSGFYPGTLLYLYEMSGDSSMLQLAEQKLEILEKEKDNKGTHDLGFMLFCSFGNAYRITGNEHYKEVMLQGAESLATRFHPETGLIKSWDHGSWKYPVIIDNMMNLEFLFWASDVSGDDKYRNINISHADSTLKNHFRDDFSSYHVVDYDPATGQVVDKKTHQGKADDSAWSRGQSWGLYGYTVMYRDTKDPAYLAQAENIAAFILDHPNMPADMVPYWDYDAPATDTTYRDASAAALNASALLELSKYTADKTKAEKYVSAAEKTLISLSSDKYRAKLGENGGFILMHSVGSLPHNSEVDVPLTYADYYYIEALKRYQEWFLD
ncbi:glycoside hydrolase family 88 protein [Echinicola vietnamensis]|uniref:Thioredoxin domain protein n=1 Tax=Echinicola vietnamensis (strain DSM 17526 / LMG 23754 / KMM 6221) TaxID=926556 RepID=L0G071_ECHVK|nr:glycoside hydrolase family 88 protein [Echinicola vietnamensis]AGA78411.1 thioredoxin domain protein [Echinicola vietnamensis DSM 17526]